MQLLPPHAEVAAELHEWDDRTFNERLERWIFIRQMTEPPSAGWSVPASLIGASAWWEAGRCFIGGNFIAAVILIQAFVEHSLAEVLRRKGVVNVDRLGFKKLIDAAERLGELTPALAAGLHRLRRLRNPYVHADADVWPPSFLERAWRETGGDSYAVSDGDARLGIETGCDYLRQIADRWDDLQRSPLTESE